MTIAATGHDDSYTTDHHLRKMSSMLAGTPIVAAPSEQDHTTPLTSPDSSTAASPAEELDVVMSSSDHLPRPKIGSRKSSGSMIVIRGQPTVGAAVEMDDTDVRAMSPRRNSTEVQKLSDDARRDLMEQARLLQTSLQAIVERVETVREEHEKLEGGNKFLQS